MILDLHGKIMEKKIEDNRLRNGRYLIRNEAVKLLDFITKYNTDEYEVTKFKNELLDVICELNTKIAKDTGNDYTKISPYYRKE